MPTHLGLAVYLWDLPSQDLFLVRVLAPLVAELRAAGSADGIWFSRFDARGPHVLVLLGTAPQEQAAVRVRLAARLESFLEPRPSGRSASRPAIDEIEARHALCRGKHQCAADLVPGLAANDSYALFLQPADEYPFSFARLARPPHREELWRRLEELAFWSLLQLVASTGRTPVAAALTWLASLDLRLRQAGASPRQYWQYQLAQGLPEIGRSPAAGQVQALTSLAASRPRRGDDRPLLAAWELVAAGYDPWPPLARLLELVLAAESAPALLREIVHWTLMQLGLPFKVQLPLLLFAWSRNAPPEAPVPSGEAGLERHSRRAGS